MYFESLLEVACVCVFVKAINLGTRCFVMKALVDCEDIKELLINNVTYKE